MNAEARAIHTHLLAEKLPPGWACEEAWPWRDGTHLVAPKRRGGVIVKERHVAVQLPGDGPARARIEVGQYVGRGWRPRLVEAARAAAWRYSARFAEPNAFTIGNRSGYDRSLETEVEVVKCGRSPDYEGGWVWRTADEAAAFIEENEHRLGFVAAVYGLLLPNGWAKDVTRRPEKSDGVHRLLRDAPITWRVQAPSRAA